MKMKAVRAKQWCEPEGLVVEEIDRPAPLKGDVLVKVGAAALNFPDILMISGKYQVKPPLPFTPGMEFSGIVEALGEGVEGWAPGDRVMAQSGIGAFAEYVTAPAANLQRVPEGLSDDQAAGFSLVYQTSYFGLVHRGQMRAGESVLVHSAAGGVGLSAVQIAKALGAGKIIATVGSDDKKALVLENGADVVVNYETEDFVEAVKKETAGKGVDVIYDPVGGPVAEKSTKCIAFDGRIVIVGFTSGEHQSYKANHVLVKNYSVVGLHWGNYRFHKPWMIEEAWKALNEMCAKGELKPVIAGRYPMDRVGDAMRFLASRKAVGKIVLHW